MKGQLSLFQNEEKPCGNKKKERFADPSQTFDEHMKRFLHYMDTKGMDERWIEMAPGEICIIIDSLADYYDIVIRNVNEMDGYAGAAWKDRLEKIKKIQARLEDSVGYNRDRQLEKCMRQKSRNVGDIGEDALVLAAKMRE